MAKRIKKAKQHRIEFFGTLSLFNIYDWLLCIGLIFCLAFIMVQVGGVRPETGLISLFLTGSLLLTSSVFVGFGRKGLPIPVNLSWIIFLPFTFIFIASQLWLAPHSAAASHELNLWMQGLILLAVASHTAQERSPLTVLAVVIGAIMLFSSIMALNQFFGKGNQAGMLISFLEPGLHQLRPHPSFTGRAVGLIGDPHGFAIFMSVLSGPAFIIAFAKRFVSGIRIFSAYLGIIAMVCVLLTLHYPSLLALCAALTLVPVIGCLTLRGKLAFYGFLAVFLAVSLYLLPLLNVSFREGFDSSFSGQFQAVRSATGEAALNMAAEAPLLGKGPEALHHHFEAHRPKGFAFSPQLFWNDYLGTLARFGLVGFFTLFAPLAFIIFRAFTEWKKLPDKEFPAAVQDKATRMKQNTMPAEKLILGSLIMGWITLLLQLPFGNALQTPAILFLLMVSIGYFTQRWPVLIIRGPLPGSFSFVILGFGTLASIMMLLAFFHPSRAAVYADEGARLLDQLEPRIFDRQFSLWQIEGVRTLLDDALASAPDDPAIHYEAGRAALLNAYADIAQRAKLAETASEHLRIANSVHSREARTLSMMGMASWLVGDIENAGKHLASAVEIAPNRHQSWYYHAAFLDAIGGDLNGALEAIERAIALDPENPTLHRMKRRIVIR